MNFFAELKRRHIYRVAAAYAVVAWVLLQLVNNLAPGLNLPNWAVTLVIVLLAIGFPVALLFCWIHQLAPTDGSAPKAAITRLDWALMGALVVVIALVSYQQLVSSRAPTTVSGPQTSIVPPETTPQAAGISIAVLPFTNLSGDTGQEFFSDGMTEEITSALAKIPNLRMVGRTSAFQFKGQNKDLRAIGQPLGATYLIEGSVRKAGERVRVTALLIKTDDGIGLWTDNYDRDLKDIFATQEDIAQAIVTALKLSLPLPKGETLVPNRTANLESYQQYLRGKALVRNGFFGDAVKALEPVVAGDPNFAPGWAYLARAYNSMAVISPVVRNGSIEEARSFIEFYRVKGEMAAKEAIHLDPKLAAGYWALASSLSQIGTFADREDLYRRALALDPNDPDVINAYSQLIGNAGHMKKALPLRRQLQVQEPLSGIINVAAALVLRANGDTKTAIGILEGARLTDPVGGFFTNAYLAQAYAADGRYTEAADTLLAIPPTNLASRKDIEQAAAMIRQAPTKMAPGELPAWGDPLFFIYPHLGATERMLEYYERNMEIGYIPVNTQVWLPEFKAVRKTERFKALMRKAGLVDYWKARGWPDLCRPIGTDDFVCD